MGSTRSISDVQDILYAVFPHLNPDDYASVNEIVSVRRTLLQAALTCKTMTRPALSVLWRSLPSDRPLLALLSAYGIVREPSSEIDLEDGPFQDASYVSRPTKHYIFSSDANPLEQVLCNATEDPRNHPQWERFQEYAIQVRRIKLTVTTAPISAPWREMANLMEGYSILPLLDAVSLYGHGIRVLNPGGLSLISASVHELSFHLVISDSDQDGIQALFLEAIEAAPHLERLHLFAPLLDPQALHALQRRERLRSLAIKSQIQAVALQPLSQLPNLETLSVCVGEEIPPVDLQLPAVRDLELKRCDWTNVDSFLANTDLPSLRSLTFSKIEHGPERLIHDGAQSFRTLSAKHPHITSLSINCVSNAQLPFHHTYEPLPTGGTLMSMVEPLLSLHALRDVRLRFRIYLFDYTSADIRAFAEAWRDLETFQLEMVTREGPGCRAGFESVVHFAHNCPRLRGLHLPEMQFDLDREGLEGVVYPERAHPLREMDVAQVVFPKDMDLSAEMTEFVRRVFPFAAVPLVEHPIVVTDESGDWSRLV